MRISCTWWANFFCYFQESLLLLWQFDYNGSWCTSFEFFLLEFIKFLVFVSMYFLKFGKLLTIISSNKLSAHFFSFWNSHNANIILIVVPHKFLRFCYFYPTHFFFLYRLNNFKWSVFKLIDYFFLSIQVCWVPLEDFNSVTVFLASEMQFDFSFIFYDLSFLFMIYLFLFMIYLFCLYSHFVHISFSRFP